MKALIVGGGIGGLACGIGLRKAGCEVEIYERASVVREVGAGLALWANAITALNRLGVGEIARTRGVLDCDAAISTREGKLLIPWSAKQMHVVTGTPSMLIHRIELLQDLLDAFGSERVRLKAEFSRFEQDESGVTAYFADGSTAHGDCLIGADGLRSAVRLQMQPKSAPRYAGYVGFRAVTEARGVRGIERFGETWGRGSKFGMYPVGDGRIYWFAETKASEGAPEPRGGRLEEVLNIVRGWHEPLPSIVRSTSEEAILRHKTYDLPPLPRWTDGRVTLLGDAAHASTPTFGQGACQALEDAVVLHDCVRKGTDVRAALQKYDSVRRPYTNKIISMSRFSGQLTLGTTPLACGVRDTVARVVPSGVWLKAFVGLAGHKGMPVV